MKNIQLYKHQQDAIDKAYPVLSSYGYFALFMEMGTGKTITSLKLGEDLFNYDKIEIIIIVCPKSIIEVWDKEINNTIDDPSIFIWDAIKCKNKSYQKDAESFLTNKKNLSFFICNIEAFQGSTPYFYTLLSKIFMKKSIMIVDESSKIKTPNIKRTRNITKLGQKSNYRMILTGTEITNSPLDLYQQFEFLKPRFFGFVRFSLFRSYYANVIDRYLANGKTYPDIIGYKNLHQLQKQISPFVFRVQKKDCLDLPEKIYENIYVDLGEARKVYDDLKKKLFCNIGDNIITVENKLALYTKFRQIVNGYMQDQGNIVAFDDKAKINALIEDIDDHSEQAIIWCSFLHDIVLIKDELAKNNYTYSIYSGEEKNIDLFIQGKARFLLATSAAAYGLNLQFCHIHYFFSRFLSPEANAQSEDRSHRIGQHNPCVYKSIIARDTVDEKIFSVLQCKKNIASMFKDGNISDLIDAI